MIPFDKLKAKCFPLSAANVDTDQLIPARFMKESRRVGYGQFLLYDLRFDSTDAPKKTFMLNQERLSDASIIVAKRNFGAGSSREAAVDALVDYGFRCVIAPSFGDIFSSNAVNNGLLPAIVKESDAECLIEYCENVLLDSSTESPIVTVDLVTQLIHCADFVISFEIKPAWRTKLLNGWDDIDLTHAYQEKIDGFFKRYEVENAWAVRPLEEKMLAIEK